MDGKPKEIRLIVGLGNPGSRYANTYHNIGADFVEKLSSNLPWENPDRLFDVATLTRDGKKVRYMIPNTFMNESGQAVAKAMKRYRLKPEEVMIIHDDSDLKLGSYKLSLGRNSAGHNGVQSVINHLKTKNFYRLRIGVRTGLGKAMDFVLSKISRDNKAVLQGVLGEMKETVIEKELIPD